MQYQLLRVSAANYGGFGSLAYDGGNRSKGFRPSFVLLAPALGRALTKHLFDSGFLTG